MYYEDFIKGQRFELNPITMTAESIDEFARLYDPQRIHIDADFAENGFYQGIIASGLHTLSTVWGEWIRLECFGDETIGGKGLDFVEWPAPVRPGDVLTTVAEAVDTIPSEHGRHGTVVLKLTSTNQHGKVVLRTQCRGILKSRFKHSREGYVEVEGGRVWYNVVGNRDAIPLIVLHGGPGSAHFSMYPLAEGLQEERPVILYDQLGCGKSDRPADGSLWTTERFVRELAQLRAHLGFEKVHILGHSWGTMLLADYLLTNPTGVASATFSSPCLSAARWVEDADRYREDLPPEVQKVLLDCERDGTTDSEAYEQATEVYMKRHVCRVEVPAKQKTLRKAAFGEEVYHAMWGPSEFHPTGSLKTYDRTDRLGEINVPSLFTCGHFDEAAPGSTEYYHSLTPGSRFHIFEKSSHSPLREQLSDYLQVIRDFLHEVESAN